MQKAIKSPVTFTGQGIHTGATVGMTIGPASADYGIWFKRTDLVVGDAMVLARWDAVVPSKLCTLIANSSGTSVSTIEHIMAALAGCGIHNALIEINGPEVPILDGSAMQFVEGILAKGIRPLSAPLRAFRILKTVEVQDGLAWARLEPAERMEMDFHIDFTDAAIGRQSRRMSLANGAFVRELCDSRTFCRQADVDPMQANGLALGGTLENAVVVDGERVLTPGGFRHSDEPVRHKMLDAVGDLCLAGAPILGRYVGNRSGHAMTNRLLRALFADPDALRLIEAGPATHDLLPGIGVHRADLLAVA